MDCRVEVGKLRLNEHLDHNCETVPEWADSLYLSLWGYQQDDLQFYLDSDFTLMNTNQMGLGKTPVTAMALRYFRKALCPALIIVPPHLSINWQKELITWYNSKFKDLEDIPIIHRNSQGGILSGQNIIIVSNAIFGKPELFKEIKEYGFKSVIVDEAHAFKSESSKRTRSFLKLAPEIPNKILLTATPVLNRTLELYPALHAMKPDRWRTRYSLDSMCSKDWNTGKSLGISSYWRDSFIKETGKYIIRRKKKDVFAEGKMPPFHREEVWVDLTEQKNFVDSYNQLLDDLEAVLDKKRGAQESHMHILAIFTKMREFVGFAKIRHILSLAIEHLDNYEDPCEKLCIGAHHIPVRDFLLEGLKEYGSVLMGAGDAQYKEDQKELFEYEEKNRVLVASILASGEGLNLQFCKNIIVGEREWNPVKEIQFEGRFYARGLDPSKDYSNTEPCVATYVLASETIDEYFSALNEFKGDIVENANAKDYSTDPIYMEELAKKVVTKRLKYVGV
jgi:SWI/SNF-related matrix-associated actin-dependent regulator 1 of chromatin subfamily A